jgi:membrane protease YdiL (CAAX protease family)
MSEPMIRIESQRKEGIAVNHSQKESVKRNPVTAFFLLAIATCFATLFPAIYLVPHDAGVFGILGFYLGKIGVYSPVLAGILVTRIIQPGQHQRPFGRRLKISLPVWLIAVIINIASLKLTAPPTVPLAGLIVLSLPVALLPAWVISSAVSGSDGVKRMLATLVRPRGSIVYYLIALLTFPVIHIVGTGITNVLQGNPWLPQVNQLPNLSFTVLVTFFFVIFFAGGINEESGWRGFAQTRLQVRFSPLVTAFILWFFMVIWHIPNDILQYQHGGYLMVRIVLYVCITILFTWIYNRTDGSILAVVIFHASMNSMNPLMGILPITTAGNIMLIGFGILVVVWDRMWRRLPQNHPAVFQAVEPRTDDLSVATN